MLQNNLVENIIFHFDSKDRLIAFEYANEVVDQSEEVCSVTGNSFSKIKSRGVVDGIETSKLPVAIDGNMFYNAAGAAQNPGAVPGAAPGAAPGGKSAKPAEKSFFQKYWTWIVGGVVYFMYKSMTAELPNQPGAAGSSGAAGKK